MKAYMLSRTGGPGVLKLGDHPKPEATRGHLLIKIKSIGLNYAEVLSRKGQYSWAPARPYIPGMEAFGEIEKVGEGVTKFKVGDHVITGGQYGRYAEYISAPEHLVFPAMDGFSAEENAALLVNYMTAWVALFRLGKLAKGESVLIQAAAGGVGTAAIQLAKSKGATIFGTASQPDKLNLIRDLGADHAINYEETDFLEYVLSNSKGMDVILEVVGGEVFRKSLKALNPFGRMIVAGFASIPLKKWNPLTYWKTWKAAPKVNIMDMAKASTSIAATHIGYLTEKPEVALKEWEELKNYIKDTSIKPYVGHIFNFDDLPKAHELMESRKSSGKIVINL